VTTDPRSLGNHALDAVRAVDELGRHDMVISVEISAHSIGGAWKEALDSMGHAYEMDLDVRRARGSAASIVSPRRAPS
jgi:hypothetical protein